MDRQSRRDLFRVTGAEGLGLVASRAIAAGGASSTPPAAVVQAQPDPPAVPSDRTTADIIIETLITWGVPVIFGMVGDGIGPLIELSACGRIRSAISAYGTRRPPPSWPAATQSIPGGWAPASRQPDRVRSIS
jgi:hypothetical protein